MITLVLKAMYHDPLVIFFLFYGLFSMFRDILDPRIDESPFFNYNHTRTEKLREELWKSRNARNVVHRKYITD